MKKIFVSAVMFAALFVIPASAEPLSPGQVRESPQVTRMKSCNVEYKERKIVKSDRRQFMGACLKKGYVAGSWQPGAASDKASIAAPGSTDTETAAQTKGESAVKKPRQARSKREPKIAAPEPAQPAQ